MWTYKNEWEEIEEVHFLNDQPSTAVTIIIPARNEAANIGHLLHDITQQVYPTQLTELIFQKTAPTIFASNMPTSIPT